MTRIIPAALLLLAACTQALAQKPQYTIAVPPAAITGDFAFCYSQPSLPTGGRWQSIYLASELAKAPSGRIVNVYLRTFGRKDNSQPSVIPAVTVKLGYTPANQFYHTANKPDTFVRNMITVFNQATYTVPAGSLDTAWLKFPVQAGLSFSLVREGNLAVEIAAGPGPVQNGFNLIASNGVQTGGSRSLGGHRDSATMLFASFSNSYMDFGFDLATTGVESLGGLSAVGLFPNPAAGGRFNVSFEALQAAGGVSISVSDAAGRQVYRRSYAGVGTAFFGEVDMHGAPAGVYFLTLTAGGERIVRSVAVD